MKRTILFVLNIFLLLVLVSSCKSKQSIVQEVGETPVISKSKEEIRYNEMLASYGLWDTFVAQGNVSLGGLSSSFELRMKHNEAVQISLRPFLGIEVARAIITTDSAFLYDKVNKHYMATSLSSLSTLLPIMPTIGNIQSIILGRPFVLGKEDITAQDYNHFKIENAQQNWIMIPQKQPGVASYLFAFDNLLLTETAGWQEGGKMQVSCTYQDHTDVAQHILPSVIKATLQSNDASYTAHITYYSASFDTPTTVTQLPSSGYKKTSFSELFKSLLK